MSAAPQFIPATDPERLGAARTALLHAAGQLLDALATFEAIETGMLNVERGCALGVEVMLEPFAGVQVLVTHIAADGAREVVIAVPGPNPAAH